MWFQKKKKKKPFLPAILCPCSEQDFSLWREERKRSEACLAEEALEGGGNCHLYLQPSQTPWGLLSRWPLLKLSEALTPFSQLRVSIDTGWLWFSHIEVVSHVLLTVKTGWVDAGTWTPSGIKHYYTSETLLDQRGLCTTGLNSWKDLKVRQIKVENCIFFPPSYIWKKISLRFHFH